jgi:hypothetical protein
LFENWNGKGEKKCPCNSIAECSIFNLLFLLYFFEFYFNNNNTIIIMMIIRNKNKKKKLREKGKGRNHAALSCYPFLFLVFFCFINNNENNKIKYILKEKITTLW